MGKQGRFRLSYPLQHTIPWKIAVKTPYQR
jgi:hypothetical protein